MPRRASGGGGERGRGGEGGRRRAEEEEGCLFRGFQDSRTPLIPGRFRFSSVPAHGHACAAARTRAAWSGAGRRGAAQGRVGLAGLRGGEGGEGHWTCVSVEISGHSPLPRIGVERLLESARAGGIACATKPHYFQKCSVDLIHFSSNRLKTFLRLKKV